MSDLESKIEAALEGATEGPWSTTGPDSVAEWMIHSEADGWAVTRR